VVGMVLGIDVLLLELVYADALLSVAFGFRGALGVDGLFGEVVGAAAGDDEGAPAVAMDGVSIVAWSIMML
jgi:hypothetical protein